MEKLVFLLKKLLRRKRAKLRNHLINKDHVITEIIILVVEEMTLGVEEDMIPDHNEKASNKKWPAS